MVARREALRADEEGAPSPAGVDGTAMKLTKTGTATKTGAATKSGATPRTGAKAGGPRARILDASLGLFNTLGLARVTTAEIAAASRMREGNLHYHFPRKAGLVEALFARFEAEAEIVAADLPGDPGDPEALLAYQRAWFDLIWRHRWLYRDGIEMVALAPALRPRVHAIRARTQALTRGVLEGAIRAGQMRIEADALTRLLDNAWIVSSHWMSFRLQGGTDLTQADLDWGFAQVADLFAPYLAAGARG